MKRFTIKLATVTDVQEFVNSIFPLDSDFDITFGRHTVDAKSIMGILSLNIRQKLELNVHSCTAEIENVLKPFLIS